MERKKEQLREKEVRSMLDQLAAEKERLRQEFLSLREHKSVCARLRSDGLIGRVLRSVPAFAQADLVLSYLSFKEEVDTVKIIQDALARGRRVALPRVLGAGRMSWHEVSSLEGLERSGIGILEPAADAEEVTDISIGASCAPVALVPGLAFDADGFRLGYGGGFYDRFLPDFHAAGGVSIGLCREDALFMHALPRAPFDCPVDLVVTESGVHHRG